MTCDRCNQPATVVFDRPRQVPGLPSKVQRLCCHHARGLRGHRGCTQCTPASTTQRPFSGSVLHQAGRDVAMTSAYWDLPGHGGAR